LFEQVAQRWNVVYFVDPFGRVVAVWVVIRPLLVSVARPMRINQEA